MSLTMRSNYYSITPKAIHTFCKNGASTRGILLFKARLAVPTSKRQRSKPPRHSTKVFSGCDSIDCRSPKSAISAPWRNWVPARIARETSLPSAQELVGRIQQLAGELARLHQGDRKLAPGDRDGFTLLVGFRSWEFAAFTALRRAETR